MAKHVMSLAKKLKLGKSFQGIRIPIWTHFVWLLLISVVGMIVISQVGVGEVHTVSRTISGLDSNEYSTKSTLDSIRDGVNQAYIDVLQAENPRTADDSQVQASITAIQGVDSLFASEQSMGSSSQLEIAKKDWLTFENDANQMLKQGASARDVSQSLQQIQSDYKQILSDFTLADGVLSDQTLGTVRATASSTGRINQMSWIVLAGITFLSIVLFTLVSLRLRNRVMGIIKTLKQLEKGIIQTKPKFVRDRSEIGLISDALKRLLQSLGGLVEQNIHQAETTFLHSAKIQEAAKYAELASAEVADVISQLAITADTETKSVDEGNRKLVSMKNDLDSILSHTNEVVMQAGEVAQISASGAEQMNTAYHLVDSMRKSAEASVVLFDSIESQFKEAILRVSIIKDIADQTQILSINASIEAARSDRELSGFSVIAQEFRDLAMLVGETSKEVHTVLDNLEETVNTSARQIRDSQNLSARGLETVLTAKTSFDLIVSKMEELKHTSDATGQAVKSNAQNIQSVNAYLQEVMLAVESTSASIEEVTATIEEQVANLHKLAEASQGLVTVSDDLRTSVAAFTIES